MKTVHYRQIWHDLQKMKHMHELLAYLPEHLLEKSVFIVLAVWMLSPLYILLRGVFLTGTDEQYIRLMLSSFWYIVLQQTGFVGWLLTLISVAKQTVKEKDQGSMVNFKDWLSDRMTPLLLGLLLIWSILSCLASDNRLMSFLGDAYRRDGLLSYLLYGGLFACATQVRSRSTVRRIMGLFVAVATLLALLTLINQSALNDLFKIKSPSAVFYNANHYAYYLCLSQMGALFLYINGRKRSLGTLLWLSAFVIIAAALLDNGSLGPYLAVVAGLVFSGFAAWRLRIPVLSRILTAIGCFIGVTVVMNLLEPNLVRDLLRLASDTQQIATGSDKAPSAGSGRWILWTNGLRMAFERPILGYGPDNLGAAYREAGISIDRPHNELIQIAASLGWPALLLYVSALVSHAIKFIRARKTVSAFECGLFAIILTYLVSSLFGNTMFYTSPFFFLILGLSVSFQKICSCCQQGREESDDHHQAGCLHDHDLGCVRIEVDGHQRYFLEADRCADQDAGGTLLLDTDLMM